MKYLILLICATLMASVSVMPPVFAAEAPASQTMPVMLATLKPTHPRLLINDGSWNEIKARRARDAEFDAFLTRQETEARALLNVEPVVYQKTGRRLLSISRMVLRRVLLLAMQYQLSGDVAFLERAQTEMLAAANFADWNPSHFLDTAEMTAALALGYDWLYDDLEAGARDTIQKAIIEKGLRAGVKDNGWIKATNNWNSVCHAGMVLGSLAVAEAEPELAAHFLNEAKQFNSLGLHPYAPEGVYPEGATYWAYGTTFQVMLLSALQTALGTDWNLSQSPGFLKSVDALLQVAGPTGAFFNYFDGTERPSLEGTTFWFARQLDRPELTQFERASLRKWQHQPVAPASIVNRTLPLVALWWPDAPAAKLNLPLSWYGAGANPLATFRARWDDPGAMFLALKGGHATLSHGHMDAGSFVFESDGVLWARDLGMQNYESLESKGVDLWNSRQDGQRWRVFRIGPFSHNTLTINGELHRATGDARITHFSAEKESGAIVDLSPVFAGQAARVTRGFSFRADQDVVIRDEIEGLNAGDDVRFAMLTEAQIAIPDDGQTAILTQNGKTLRVRLDASVAAKWAVESAQGPQDYDAPNPGAQILVAHFKSPDAGKVNWSVTLTPGSAPDSPANPLAVMPLADWPFPPLATP